MNNTSKLERAMESVSEYLEELDYILDDLDQAKIDHLTNELQRMKRLIQTISQKPRALDLRVSLWIEDQGYTSGDVRVGLNELFTLYKETTKDEHMNKALFSRLVTRAGIPPAKRAQVLGIRSRSFYLNKGV